MKSKAPKIAAPAPTVETASYAVTIEIIKAITIINFIYFILIVIKTIKMASTSRLIVRNLPKHLKESELREHFKRDNKYSVTDAKIMFAGTKTRQFGFVGFKSASDATEALKWFNGTFLHTSKL